MKKIIAVISVLVLMFSFSACKKTEVEEKKPTETEVKVDKGQQAAEENADILKDLEPEAQQEALPSVSVEDIEKYAKENGADSVTVNKDGSVKVDMPDEEYDAMMEKLGISILEKLDAIRQGSDMILSVQSGLEFDKYYIFVDKASYEANPDVIDINECFESAEVYQMLSGKKPKDIKVTLHIMNKDDDLEIARKVYTVKE